jgi:hypothetical protein
MPKHDAHWIAAIAGLPLLVIVVGCSDSPTPAPQGAAGVAGASGQGAVAGASSSAGSNAASGGSNASGSSTGGEGGNAGRDFGGTSSGGTAGTVSVSGSSNGGAAAAGGGSGGEPASFGCTLVIGCFQTSQWFDAGFQAAVGDEKWQIKADHNTFTENWANPTDAFWSLPVASPCANGAQAPDRVLFVAYSKTLTTKEAWETQLSKVVDNVKTKLPSVKRVDLLGLVRAPNNEMCANNNSASTVVRPEQDEAMQAVADKSAGLVKVGPQYFAASCDSFVTNNTNLTAAAAVEVASALSPSYE